MIIELEVDDTGGLSGILDDELGHVPAQATTRGGTGGWAARGR
jgi:hypothetical protein